MQIAGLNDEKQEWIEIYNSSNVDVNLSGWKAQDREGITTTYSFPKDATITGKGYLVLKRPDTHITLNNDGDSLYLIMPNGKMIDSVLYKNAPKRQSYNRTPARLASNASLGEANWQWSTTVTPGAMNSITANRSKEKRGNTTGFVAEKNIIAKK